MPGCETVRPALPRARPFPGNSRLGVRGSAAARPPQGGPSSVGVLAKLAVAKQEQPDQRSGRRDVRWSQRLLAADASLFAADALGDQETVTQTRETPQRKGVFAIILKNSSEKPGFPGGFFSWSGETPNSRERNHKKFRACTDWTVASGVRCNWRQPGDPLGTFCIYGQAEWILRLNGGRLSS